MGTPEFAVPSLNALTQSRHDVVAVVTAPDKPVGRGLKIQPSPIKKAALDLKIPILQPDDLQNKGFVESLKALGADLSVVVAFRILPPEVFNLPTFGTINLHASLLPKYRGAAPINWAIINGEEETGVTTIFIKERVDTGDIILQKRIEIGNDETAGELHDKLSCLGAELVVETVDLLETGQAPQIQQSGEVTKAPKLTKDLGRIQWAHPDEKIRNLIRGLSPSPGAYAYLKGKMIKVYRARTATLTPGSTARPGEVIQLDPGSGKITVAAGAGAIDLLELQPEGKRRMSSDEFLRGYKVNVGDRFE